MKRMWLATTLVLCGLAQALIGGQAAHAADVATGAKLLPKETLVFFSAPNVPKFNDEFDKSLMGAMLRDPELKPFLDDVRKKIDEYSVKVQDELGVSIAELLAIPQGEITFGLLEKPARKLAPVLIVDYGDHKETIEKLLKKMHDELKGDVAEHSTQEVNDVTVHVYTFNSRGPFKTAAYFNEDSRLVFSSEVAALKEVLTRWKGDGENSLASTEAYKYVLDRCKDESGEPAMVWFANPIGMIRTGLSLAQATQGGGAAGMAAIFLPTLGVDKLKGVGGAGYYGTGDFDALTKGFLYADQPNKGVVEVFQFPAADLAPPKWVPATTSTYFSGNWSVTEAYQAVEKLLDGFYGPGFTAKQLDAAADGGPGIHVKKDVIDLMDGKFHFIQGVEESEDGPATPKLLLALDVKDAAKMKKTLIKAVKSSGAIETREFNGETIYEISAGPQTISLAVASGHFVVTNDTTTLEAMLRTETQPALIDSDDYRMIAKHFPAKVSMISFSKSDAQFKALYDLLKNADNAEFLDGIDLQKLPPFEVLQKYLRASGSYTVPDKKGALFVGFQLRDGK